MNKKRLFNVSDYVVFERLGATILLFQERMATFTAFDASLNATFLANWKAAQKELMECMRDKTVVAGGVILSNEAESALQKCRVKYRDVKYFAGKAFPSNADVLKEFGEGQFTKWRNSPLRMVQFMETLHRVALKYKTNLIAAGYTQAAIDEIEVLMQQLREDNTLQQVNKNERPTTTRQRIQIANTTYSYAQKVAAAAAVIFFNNKVQRDLFRLPARPRKSTIKTSIQLMPGSLRKVALRELLKRYNATLANPSKSAVSYWRADSLKADPAQKHELPAGRQIDIKVEAPGNKFLIIQNTTAKPLRLVLSKTKKP